VIVDSHTHIFPPEFIRQRAQLCERDSLFREMYADPAATMATVDDLLASIDANGIDAAVICGFGWDDPGLCREHNDVILSAASAHPERLLPAISVTPGDLTAARGEADRCLALGARLIGELRPERSGLDLADPVAADALAEVAGGLPLLIHATEPAGHRYPGKEGQSLGGLYRFIERHPEATVIAAHLGGGLPLYAHMPEVRQAIANVYVDTAAWSLLYEPEILRHTADLIGARHILFATDFPLRRHRSELRKLRAAPLTPEERDAVLGGNAARLFGLET
jgi:uncharacterized protein